MLLFKDINAFKELIKSLKDKLSTHEFVEELDKFSFKLNKNYSTLSTGDKSILGAINELNSFIDIDYNDLLNQINVLDSNTPSEYEVATVNNGRVDNCKIK